MKTKPLRFGSVCSGIEAATVAWSPLGWQAAWLSEIEPFPTELLAYHYPDVPNLGNMLTLPERITTGEVEAPDVFCGGTPCQAFSVAGNRESLGDDRGNLTLTFCEIADAIDTKRTNRGEVPTIVFWENVPGVLNTKDNAFGCFLGELSGAGHPLDPAGHSKSNRWTNAGYVLGSKRAVAWRVLDAQYFGLAQRRKRVFVVASARDDIDPREILFEYEGVRRDTAPSREAGQDTAPTTGTGFTASSFADYREGVGTLRAAGGDLGGGSETLVTSKWPADIACTLNASFGDKLGLENQHIDGGAPLFVPTIAFNSRQDPVSGDVFGALDTSSPQAQAVVYPLNSMTMLGRPSDELKPRMGSGIGKPSDPQNTLSAAHHHAVAIAGNIIGRQLHNGGNGNGFDDSGVCYTLTTVDQHAVATQMAVRRLTPVECERLMGFPDSYTQIPWRNKPKEDCPDGHRYKALGNSWAVPVVAWIGRRIDQVVRTPQPHDDLC